MLSGYGNYLKSTQRGQLFGRVRLEFVPLASGDITVVFAPSAYPEGVRHDAPGWVAWRRGVETGVRVGAKMAKVTAGAVQIVSIVGTYVDSTESSMLGAGALALWDAVGFHGQPAERAQLDELVLAAEESSFVQ